MVDAITFIPYVLAGVMFGIFILYTEVLFPIRVVIKKKRRNAEETVLAWGKIKHNKKDQKKTLIVPKEKLNKELNEEYQPSITTGLIGRKKLLVEMASPSNGQYFFTKGLNWDNKLIKQDLLSQSDRQGIIHAARKATYLTPEKKTNWDKLLPMINVMMPIIVVIAIILIVQFMHKEVVAMFSEAATTFVNRVTEGLASIPVEQIP